MRMVSFVESGVIPYYMMIVRSVFVSQKWLAMKRIFIVLFMCQSEETLVWETLGINDEMLRQERERNIELDKAFDYMSLYSTNHRLTQSKSE